MKSIVKIITVLIIYWFIPVIIWFTAKEPILAILKPLPMPIFPWLFLWIISSATWVFFIAPRIIGWTFEDQPTVK